MTKEKNQSLTVFKSDRHEDIAAIILAAVVVCAVLVTMAFITPTVTVHADTSGVISEIAVTQNAEVNKGDLLYTIVSYEKVWKGDVSEDVRKEKKVKAKTGGTVVEIYAKVNDKVSKNKTPVLEFKHHRGTLP